MMMVMSGTNEMGGANDMEGTNEMDGTKGPMKWMGPRDQ